MSKSVSVIIPVYNVEQYLRQCLDSVINQTYKNLKIIIVNDGSPDNSLSICEEYAKKDDRITVINQKNQGPGCARNNALKIVNTDYVTFVDSDDYLDLDYLETLVKMTNQADFDVVCGEVNEFWDDGSNPDSIQQKYSDDLSISIDAYNKEKFYSGYYFGGIYKHYAWGKIYRTSLLKTYNVVFGDNKHIFAEDTWFQLQLLISNPRIGFVGGSCYQYRQRRTSIMHSPKNNLVVRQGKMVEDYDALVATVVNNSVEKKVCALVAVECITMEALNQTGFGGCFTDFREKMKFMRNNRIVVKNIKNIFKIFAFNLEKKRSRKLFLFVCGLLYCLRMVYFADLLTWVIYKQKKNVWA